MFTGLVESTGSITRAEHGPGGLGLTVASELAARLEPGGSVAVDGVCLTATSVEDGSFRCDVMAETLRRSAFERVAEGERVNLELPLTPADPLGGHFVQGHVDGTGSVESIEEEGFARVVRIVPGDASLMRYVVEKGSVALNGVSLTVAAADDDGFSVSLIPETLERTTLGGLEPGAAVNIETDVLARYVEKLTVRA